MELEPEIADVVPWSDKLTAYDEKHIVIYMRLLDARAVGARDDDIARLVLRIDPLKEPERSRRALASHISRAQWMTKYGYLELLKG